MSVMQVYVTNALSSSCHSRPSLDCEWSLILATAICGAGEIHTRARGNFEETRPSGLVEVSRARVYFARPTNRHRQETTRSLALVLSLINMHVTQNLK